jgi:hypothetical protein
MAYVITNTRGQTIATILTGEDNTTATDLTLIGQNYIEFGLAQNENFVYILENFAAPTPPLHPIQGQLWFDTANGQLKVRQDVNTWTGLADQNYVQAQKISPEFTGVPRAPTAPGGSATTQIATTAFVQGEIATINLTPYARLDGAVFTGNLAANTAATSTATTQVATTAFVHNLFNDTAGSLYVTKVDGEMLGDARAPTLSNIFSNSNRIATTQWVQNLYGNVFVSPYAPKDSPALTGIPQAPTAPVSTSNTQIATTAFVQTLFANVDLSVYAPKSNPTLTGVPRAPTADASDNTTQIATTNFVQLQKTSPAFTGVPTAPTAAANTANTQIATTAFVAAATAGFISAASVDELAGSIKMWASVTPPANWALCNGQAISRTAYATLFSRIGTTYGSGDGSTTFNLPDFRDRFPVGAGAAYNAGATGGFADAAVVSHTHPIANQSVSINDPGHRHELSDPVSGAKFFGINDWLNNNVAPASWQRNPPFASPPILSPNLTNPNSPFVGDGPAGSLDASLYGWTNTVTTGITGSVNISISAPTGSVSGTGRNLPPYLGAYWIIKISDDGSGGGTLQAGAGIDITTAGLYSTITNTGVKSLTAGAGISISGSSGNLTITNTGSLPTLVAGQGISIAQSNTTFTITNTVTAPIVVAGPGITVTNAAGGATVSASVVSLQAGSGISLTNNSGTYTLSTNVSAFPQIVFAQNSGQLSINLALPNGTWLITANFCNHEAAFPAQNLLIDGVVVQTLPNSGDPPGTSYRPMLGMREVNGGRTISCSVTGVSSEYGDLNSRRFVVRGDRIG